MSIGSYIVTQLEPTRMRIKCARRFSDKKQVCRSSLSAWIIFAPKLTTTLTVTEKTIPVLAHVAFLRRTLTNPLKHGDAIAEHDCGVQILADVFDAGSAQPQSPPIARFGRSTVLSLDHRSRRAASCCPKNESFFPVCCTMLTSAI